MPLLKPDHRSAVLISRCPLPARCPRHMPRYRPSVIRHFSLDPQGPLGYIAYEFRLYPPHTLYVFTLKMIPWPSGYVVGIVPRMGPDYRQHALILSEERPAGEHDQILAVYGADGPGRCRPGEPMTWAGCEGILWGALCVYCGGSPLRTRSSCAGDADRLSFSVNDQPLSYTDQGWWVDTTSLCPLDSSRSGSWLGSEEI